MEKIVLEANRRTVVGKKVKRLRQAGVLPALLFGHGIDSTPIQVDKRDARKILDITGASTLLSLSLEGTEHNVLVRERQRDVLTREYLHVDFQAVSMTEKVIASVRIEIGDVEAPAVQSYGAIINTGLDVLEIECLPNDLIDSFVVDVSGLEEIGDSILVKDLKMPNGIEVLDDPTGLIVVVSAPMGEEEVEEEVLEEGLEPEVIEKGLVEEDEE